MGNIVCCCKKWFQRSEGWSEAKALLPTERAVAVVGDSGSGKTSMIFRFTRGRMPSAEEIRTSLETDETELTRNGKKVRLLIHDTSGEEQYARLRGLTYNQSDVILICFALNSPESLTRVESDWAPEVRHLCHGCSFLLVGTKKDMRDNTSVGMTTAKFQKSFVTTKQGKKTAKNIGAAAYFECSALDSIDGGKAVKRVFGQVVREALKIK